MKCYLKVMKLDEAWKLAVKKGLNYERFGDAIRKLGYIPQVKYVE